VKLIAVFCILSWRVFWMTMIGRSAPEANPRTAFTDEKRAILGCLVHNKGLPARTLSQLAKVAQLGGYLARARDPPPGTLVMWRGFSQRADITLGASLTTAALKCG
jgi:hypothetical protein